MEVRRLITAVLSKIVFLCTSHEVGKFIEFSLPAVTDGNLTFLHAFIKFRII